MQIWLQNNSLCNQGMNAVAHGHVLLIVSNSVYNIIEVAVVVS